VVLQLLVRLCALRLVLLVLLLVVLLLLLLGRMLLLLLLLVGLALLVLVGCALCRQEAVVLCRQDAQVAGGLLGHAFRFEFVPRCRRERFHDAVTLRFNRLAHCCRFVQ